MYLFREDLPKVITKARFLHATPNAPSVDIYINDKLLFSNISFGKITKYFVLPLGKAEIKVYATGNNETPLYTKITEVPPNGFYTIALAPNNNELYSFVLKDSTNVGSISSGFLRFINISPNAPLLTLSLPNDIKLFSSVEYLETTGYYSTSPGIYNFKVEFSGANAFYKYIKNVELKNGNFYTIYIIGLINNKPPIGYLLVKDGE